MLALLLTVLVSTHTVGELKQAAPKPEVFQCFTASKVEMVWAGDETINGHRVNLQAFDLDSDGVNMLLAAYEYVNGVSRLLRPFPTSYRLLRDGEPIKEMIDTKGDGRCDDMVEIPIGSAFTGKRL